MIYSQWCSETKDLPAACNAGDKNTGLRLYCGFPVIYLQILSFIYLRIFVDN
ncbi:hypothetical protein HMPREF1144_2450 [Klebsiella sp. OBRC7]|nr:hypothetical protein HMPREF1144_2450 [Klebsiella sp. OBRC7]